MTELLSQKTNARKQLLKESIVARLNHPSSTVSVSVGGILEHLKGENTDLEFNRTIVTGLLGELEAEGRVMKNEVGGFYIKPASGI